MIGLSDLQCGTAGLAPGRAGASPQKAAFPLRGLFGESGFLLCQTRRAGLAPRQRAVKISRHDAPTRQSGGLPRRLRVPPSLNGLQTSKLAIQPGELARHPAKLGIHPGHLGIQNRDVRQDPRDVGQVCRDVDQVRRDVGQVYPAVDQVCRDGCQISGMCAKITGLPAKITGMRARITGMRAKNTGMGAKFGRLAGASTEIQAAPPGLRPSGASPAGLLSGLQRPLSGNSAAEADGRTPLPATRHFFTLLPTSTTHYHARRI